MIAALGLAGRNLTRNPRRTAITMAAVAFGTAMVALAISLIDGMLLGAVSNATNLYVGEVQIHAEEYMERKSFYAAIADPDTIVGEAEANGIQAVARSYGYGLLAHGSKSAGASIWGVLPEAEIDAFDLEQHIADGVRPTIKDLPANVVNIVRRRIRLNPRAKVTFRTDVCSR